MARKLSLPFPPEAGTVKLTVSLSRDVAVALVQTAARKGVPKSRLVERALMEFPPVKDMIALLEKEPEFTVGSRPSRSLVAPAR